MVGDHKDDKGAGASVVLCLRGSQQTQSRQSRKAGAFYHNALAVPFQGTLFVYFSKI